MNYAEVLRTLTGGEAMAIYEREPLSKHSTWSIGGPADVLVEPDSLEQCSKILSFTEEHRIPRIIIGKGSNLLFDDEGFRGVVMKIGRELSHFSIDRATVRAEAGIAICKLARAAGLAGLTGLEHTIGIPGTLGGLIAMNGGSRRECIGDVISLVKAIDYSGRIHEISREECSFSYRSSMFQDAELVILEAEMHLERGDPSAIRADMLSILRGRRAKFPMNLPNCGSVFVSDAELYSRFGPPGMIIEQAGLKGLRVGDAEVSRRHANFIVNTGNARASDVIELIGQVRSAVHDKTGIWMECEVRYVTATGESCRGKDTCSQTDEQDTSYR